MTKISTLSGQEQGSFADDTTCEVLVAAMTHEAEGVIGLVLRHATGEDLPAWEPGAHLDLHLPSGTVRSYSLCGDPADRSTYRLAVLRETAGRGASIEVHDTQLVGRRLTARGPRNHFPLVDAPSYVVIAGGIGITPVLPMLREIARVGRPWTLLYLGRSRTTMAFLDEVASLPGGRVEIVAGDERPRIDLTALLAESAGDAAVYACGPERLLHALESLDLGDRLHLERFGRPMLARSTHVPDTGPNLVDATSPTPGGLVPVEADGIDPDSGFDVELVASGVTLRVEPGDSILGRAREIRQGLSFSCADGYCGTCETAVLGGIPDHRDSVLSVEEQAENETMMICVGRSRTARLSLDL